jgi:ATP-dependent Clp protease adaptor protein ClpS
MADNGDLKQQPAKTCIKQPSFFQVVLFNDDLTTQEFVVMLLITVFAKNEVDAHTTMLQIHEKGRGVAGVYPLDIALYRVQQAKAMVNAAQFPLKITYEKV